jgi:hypothetical protein
MAWTERYCRGDAAGGGDGTTNTNSGGTGAWTFAEAIANVTAGTRVNIALAGGTLAQTTNVRTASVAGTTTAPIWWRGFNTTIGDCDLDDTLTKPLITFTTGRMVLSGAHQIVSSLRFTASAPTNNTYNTSGGSIVSYQLQIENTQANVNAGAFGGGTAANPTFFRCYFKCTNTAATNCNAATGGEWTACVFDGGIIGANCVGSACTLRGCVFDSQVTTAVGMSSNTPVKVLNCSMYNTVNGVLATSLASGHSIEDCIFHTCTTAINNNTGTNTNLLFRRGNSYYNCGTTEAGVGDSPVFEERTETSDPFVNAAGDDFSLVGSALSRWPGSGALPAAYQNQTYRSFLDRGALQRKDIPFLLGMTGGMRG